jgi:hypothetical protein
MKLIYPNGTVKMSKFFPVKFTGKIIYDNGNKFYFVNGYINREGGLPAAEMEDGSKGYWVNKHKTGAFYGNVPANKRSSLL